VRSRLTARTTDSIAVMSRLTLAMADAAEWTDRRSGCRQRTGFIGPVGARLFASVHLPVDPAVAGVIVCSPLFVEAERNYRREVLLGRCLAQRGIACLRFHYRGTGNSDDVNAVTIDSMLDDARTGADELESMGVRRSGIVGTRIASLVAARLAAPMPNAPIVFWAPVDASKWIREVSRSSRIAALTDHGGPPPRTNPHAGDTLEAMGYTLLPRGFVGAPPLDPPAGGAVLVVQMDRHGTLARGYGEMAARWTAAGTDVSSAVFRMDQPWWFLDHEWTVAEEQRQCRELCEPTSAWLAEQLTR
jgi:hypothetical protein